MAKSKERDGCAILMRRTFLFLVGLGIAKLLKEYFAIADNRATAWSFLQKTTEILKRKYLTWRTGEPEVVTAPSTPPQSDRTDKPHNGTDKPHNGTDKPHNGTDKPENKPEQIEENIAETIVEEPKTPATFEIAKDAKPLEFEKKTLFGVSFYQTTNYFFELIICRMSD